MAAAASRVIVADESRDSADTLAAVLACNGVDARAVYDGRDAITIAGLWSPDAAILDIALPGISGFEVAREFRNRYGRRIRLVAHTAWSSDTDRNRALECGFDDFLVKPAQADKLLAALGHETALLVKRSVAARREQVRRQIALGHALLSRPHATGGERLREVLSRALESCRLGIDDLMLESRERDELLADIARLAARVEQAGRAS